MPANVIPRVKENEPLSAKAVNKRIDIINRMWNFSVGSGLLLQQGAEGINLSLARSIPSRWQTVENDDSVTLSARELCYVSDWGGTDGRIIKVKRAGTDLYAFGPPTLGALAGSDIAAGKKGMVTFQWPAIVNYAGADPTIGDPYGPKDGVGAATKDYMGLIVLGSVSTADNLAVMNYFPTTKVVGVIFTDLLDDGEETMTIEVGPRGTETTTGFTVEVSTRLLATTEQFESTANVLTAWWSYGKWLVDGSLLCPDLTP